MNLDELAVVVDEAVTVLVAPYATSVPYRVSVAPYAMSVPGIGSTIRYVSTGNRAGRYHHTLCPYRGARSRRVGWYLAGAVHVEEALVTCAPRLLHLLLQPARRGTPTCARLSAEVT
eukprot:2655066-Rhodomonas_salina.1